MPSPQTKLTEQMVEGLALLFKEGALIEDACQTMGISKTTYQKWRRAAERIEASSKPRLSEREALLLQFLQATREARSEGVWIVAERYLKEKEKLQRAGKWQRSRR